MVKRLIRFYVGNEWKYRSERAHRGTLKRDKTGRTVKYKEWWRAGRRLDGVVQLNKNGGKIIRRVESGRFIEWNRFLRYSLLLLLYICHRLQNIFQKFTLPELVIRLLRNACKFFRVYEKLSKVSLKYFLRVSTKFRRISSRHTRCAFDATKGLASGPGACTRLMVELPLLKYRRKIWPGRGWPRKTPK